MQSSYFTPEEKMAGFLKDAAMNNQEGIFLSGITDRSVQRLLPPPLELADPENPIFYLYIVNIREPTFAPWYMEGGIGVIARYKEKTGVYFFNLQLSGPGALMGAFTGREGSGLPKKLCERIVVERCDEYGHCYIERNGVRLVDVALKMGAYNQPDFHQEQEKAQTQAGGLLLEGGCLLHKYRLNSETGIDDLEMIYYDSPTRYYSWEPASATVKFTSSIDDPWAKYQWCPWCQPAGLSVIISYATCRPSTDIPRKKEKKSCNTSLPGDTTEVCFANHTNVIPDEYN